MLSRRTKCRISAGLAAGCATMGLALLSAPPSMAGGCANANASFGSLSKSQARASVTCLFNQARSANNLSQNGDLQRAAQGHTNTMRSQNCFSHQCPGEPNLRQRINNTGYFNGAGQAAELIAFGDADDTTPPPEDTPDAIVDKWLDSTDHRNVIQNPVYKHVGVGVNVQNGTALVTAILGKP